LVEILSPPDLADFEFGERCLHRFPRKPNATLADADHGNQPSRNEALNSAPGEFQTPCQIVLSE
jgi:hypothetical protein